MRMHACIDVCNMWRCVVMHACHACVVACMYQMYVLYAMYYVYDMHVLYLNDLLCLIPRIEINDIKIEYINYLIKKK